MADRDRRVSTSFLRARRGGGLTLPLLLLLPLFGCSRDDGPTPRVMEVSTEQEALQLVTHFFDAYVHVDIDTTSRLLCERDPENLGRVRAFVHHTQGKGSPDRVDAFQIRSAVPMWIGKEPYFRVEVSFPRKSGRGEILHQYRVRVREGCLEGFLEPGPGPRPAPPSVGPGIDVGDDDLDPLLPQDEGPPGSSEPAAPPSAPTIDPSPPPARGDDDAIISL